MNNYILVNGALNLYKTIVSGFFFKSYVEGIFVLGGLAFCKNHSRDKCCQSVVSNPPTGCSTLGEYEDLFGDPLTNLSLEQVYCHLENKLFHSDKIKCQEIICLGWSDFPEESPQGVMASD